MEEAQGNLAQEQDQKCNGEIRHPRGDASSL